MKFKGFKQTSEDLLEIYKNFYTDTPVRATGATITGIGVLAALTTLLSPLYALGAFLCAGAGHFFAEMGLFTPSNYSSENTLPNEQNDTPDSDTKSEHGNENDTTPGLINKLNEDPDVVQQQKEADEAEKLKAEQEAAEEKVRLEAEQKAAEQKAAEEARLKAEQEAANQSKTNQEDTVTDTPGL